MICQERDISKGLKPNEIKLIFRGLNPQRLKTGFKDFMKGGKLFGPSVSPSREKCNFVR